MTLPAGSLSMKCDLNLNSLKVRMAGTAGDQV